MEYATNATQCISLTYMCGVIFRKRFQNIIVCMDKAQRGGREQNLVLLELRNSSAISRAEFDHKTLKFDRIIQVQVVDNLAFTLLRVT
jgi:hypothetical protein